MTRVKILWLNLAPRQWPCSWSADQQPFSETVAKFRVRIPPSQHVLVLPQNDRNQWKSSTVAESFQQHQQQCHHHQLCQQRQQRQRQRGQQRQHQRQQQAERREKHERAGEATLILWPRESCCCCWGCPQRPRATQLFHKVPALPQQQFSIEQLSSGQGEQHCPNQH